MNEGLIICFTLIPTMLLFRWYYSGVLPLFQNLMSISLLILISIAMLFVYKSSLSKSIRTKNLQKVVTNTLKDVDAVTTFHRKKHDKIPSPSFPQDEESKKYNKKIVDMALIVGFCSFVPLLIILYLIDKHFLKNFGLNLLSVGILTIIQVFYTYSVRENYTDQNLEVIRYVILGEIEDKYGPITD